MSVAHHGDRNADAGGLRVSARGLVSAVALAGRSAPGSLAGYLILTAIVGAVPLATAWLTKLVLDRLTTPPVPVTAVVVLAVAMATTATAAAVLPLVIRYLQGRLGRRVGLHAQDRLFGAVERIRGLRPFEDPRFLDRLRLARQAGSRPTDLVESMVGCTIALFTAVGFVISLATVSPFMALALVGSALPALVAQLRLSRHHVATSWAISSRYRREVFYADLLTSVRAAKEIRLFGAGSLLRGLMRSERKAINIVDERLDRRNLLVHGVLALLTAAMVGTGLVWAVHAAGAGRLSAGDVTLFVAAAAGIQAALGRATEDFARAHQALLEFGHYLAVEEGSGDLTRPASVRPVPTLRDGIELRDVWFRYGSDHPWVLRGVSMFIPYGQSVALVGRNGSGKSTLVKLLCRLYDPTTGAVLWDGVDLRDLPVDDLRRRISALFQDYVQYELTAAQNIALGDADALHDRCRIEAAAALSGADHDIRRLPHGYDTLLTRSFSNDDKGAPATTVTLSGGQWQRLALARAVLRHDAELLILDEPSSGLDAEAEYQIHTDLRQHRLGRTSVLVSHRLNAVRDADRIVVLADGAVAETGDHESLVAGNSLYQQLFALQAKGYRESNLPPKHQRVSG